MSGPPSERDAWLALAAERAAVMRAVGVAVLAVVLALVAGSMTLALL
ncbi:hypothetical protein [Sphingomonas abietis]|uniref:Uncharacterized protein n=1 Tax=Sphingomonas abietis TaxID=3012344 RepID=A0ABY7NK75_9SPHN|nr:hypothetical protein [Sphingomonas abietis]WBO21889.1 hypothetical protein PBT88_17235 [Sphingomonas abietis]